MLASLQGIVAVVGNYIVPFLLLVTPVVFFHELGHFLVARAFGVNVETFSIGFGPAIASWRDRKGTRWKISWIPLGGYVKFLGDANAASIPDSESIAHMSAQERAGAFPLKPLYQRALVVVAGPLANFILAIAILASFLLVFGTVAAPPIVRKVEPATAAATAGFKSGDTIKSIDGVAIENFDQIRDLIWDRAGQTITVVVRRDGKEFSLRATPRATVVKALGQTQTIGQLGILGPAANQWTVVRYGPISAVVEASRETWSVVATTFDFLLRRFTFQLGGDQVRGPIGIAQMSGQVAAVSYLYLFKLAAFISISLGLVNLFPIPVLDGGHLLYYGCEAVLGRPLGARAQDVGFRLGLALMLGLFLFATWNDIARLLKP